MKHTNSKNAKLAQLPVVATCLLPAALHDALLGQCVQRVSTEHCWADPAIQAIQHIVPTTVRDELGNGARAMPPRYAFQLLSQKLIVILPWAVWWFGSDSVGQSRRPESTRYRWRSGIRKTVDDQVNEALTAAQELLDAEGLIEGCAA